MQPSQDNNESIDDTVSTGSGASAPSKAKKVKVQKERPFNFDKYNKRHVLLKFAYLGWNYQGYTTQDCTNQTIEHHIFEAFTRTKLIQSRETSNYHRCGRTDKGVSAFCQVVSIDFRSNCASGEGVIVNPKSDITNTDIANEINYVKLLNGVLPEDIRALAWSPVKSEMSARFDCIERTYRYYFPKGDLDIDLMRDAGKRLVGEHDFRNFCKMDVQNGVVTFFRRIDNVTFTILDDKPNIYSTVELIIEGSSFLWHQIRYTVGVLFLVGQRKEAPSIVDDLLNVDKWPCKPQYTMSSEYPLVLFDCQYKSEDVRWRHDRHELGKVVKHLQNMWVTFHTQSTIVKRMIDHLEADLVDDNDGKKEEEPAPTCSNQRTLEQPYYTLLGKSQALNHVKFSDRQKAQSLEDRVDHYVKKRKLDEKFAYDKISEAKELAKTLKNSYNNNMTD